MHKRLIAILSLILLLPLPSKLHAQNALVDTDKDGLNDAYEAFFSTNPLEKDSDGDGFTDYNEIINQFDPRKTNGIKLPLVDTDGDVLWDYEEVRWGTDPENPDSDRDGEKDKVELINGKNPNGEGMLEKWIKIDLGDQTLSYGYGPKLVKSFTTSTGKPGFKTPTGTYSINNKVPLAWSKTYGLWMPYWMSFIGNMYGIHELPYWPSGAREGASSLGKTASHGCVRLGLRSAETLYNWAEVGTKVVVQE